jgi:hypothetical protein
MKMNNFLYIIMNFYKTFSEYHMKRNERKEKIKILCYAVGIALIGLSVVLLCAFVASVI